MFDLNDITHENNRGHDKNGHTFQIIHTEC